MIDKNKVYKTRDGREVRIYATDGAMPYPVHGAIKMAEGWVRIAWEKDGTYALSCEQTDLIEVRPRHKRVVWLHVFEDSIICAKEPAYYDITNRIACLRVELDFEEGEGL